MGGGRNKMEGGVLFQIPLKLGGGVVIKRGGKYFLKYAQNGLKMLFSCVFG